jgi:cytochrome c oxidase assembly protein subunit 15
MGCPDWPKCYGHFIPPSDISEVVFKPHFKYSKKDFIIHNQKLYYSKSAFLSDMHFNAPDWQVFEEHNYAEFNATHTWIESLNRYLGVFVGFWVIGLVVYAYILFKKHKLLDSEIDYSKVLFYSVLAFVFVVIQGIIGKYLVSSNLKSNLLILHMLFTFTVLYAVIYVLYHTSTKTYTSVNNSKTFNIVKFVIFLTIIQTILGTQVTSNVESLIRLHILRNNFVTHFNFWFYIHRSFSILILLSNIYLCFRINKFENNPFFKTFSFLILCIIAVEIFVGITLNYWGYPRFAQPLHLLLGTILMSVQFYLYIVFQKSVANKHER